MEFQQKLKNPYISIGGSYGGNQSWFAEKHKYMSMSGCGVVAAGDLLLYLSRYHAGCRTEETTGLEEADGRISRPRYEQYLLNLRNRYFPVIPFFGMPSFTLIIGLNRYFRRYRIPLRASWGLTVGSMDRRMKEMLEQDIPVIMSVGPNFPLFFGKNKVNFYTESAGGLICAAKTKAHYITATAVGKERIRISSWGKSYLIDRAEYLDYIKKHSSAAVSNLCCIRKH